MNPQPTSERERAVVEQSASSPAHHAGDGGANPTPRLQSSEWRVYPIPYREAAEIVKRWHYSKSAPNTATYAFGLQHVDSLLERLGATIWIPPTRSAAESMAWDEWRGVLACSRLVVAPGVPKNAASFLLAHSRRQIDRERWPALVSYADTGQGHDGAIYRADGWVCDGPMAAGDTWIGPDGEQRGRKRGGRTLKADEMRALGFVRAPSMPKIRYRHIARAGVSRV